MAVVQFRILGPLEAQNGSEPLQLGGPKQRAILEAFLLHPNEVVSREQLVDAVWGEAPPADGAAAVKSYVSKLRKTLAAADPTIRVQSRAGGYRLEVDADQIDASRFECLCLDGRRALDEHDYRLATALLTEALSLWRGSPVADLDTAHARADARRLEELQLGALADRIDAELALGRHSAVIAPLERLVAGQPFDERLRRQLMVALYRSGRRADALELYRDTRRLLAEQLGLEPGDELRALERAMLNNEPTLQAPASAPDKNGAAPPRLDEARPKPRPRRLWAVLGAVVIAVGAVAGAISATRGSGEVAVRARSIGVLDPASDAVVADVPLGTAPRNIAVGGSVWAATDASTLVRVDPNTRTIAQTIDLHSTPTGVALAGGSVWILQLAVVTYDVKETLARIDPRFGDVASTLNTRGGDFSIDMDALAAGAGALWIAHTGRPGVLFRASPATGKLMKVIPLDREPDAGSASAVAVAAGSVWVTQGGGDLLRLDAVSGAPQMHISLGDGIEPVALAVGNGAVWVASRPRLDSNTGKILGTGTVTQVDPRTNAVVATIETGGTPAGIAVGDGAVWVADQAGHRVIKIDPRTNDIVDRIDVGRPPSAIAFGVKMLWVGVR